MCSITFRSIFKAVAHSSPDGECRSVVCGYSRTSPRYAHVPAGSNEKHYGEFGHADGRGRPGDRASPRRLGVTPGTHRIGQASGRRVPPDQATTYAAALPAAAGQSGKNVSLTLVNDVDFAWLCWNHARDLSRYLTSPTGQQEATELLASVETLEEQLAKEHPSWFPQR
mmetsp:Transcript_13656/g.38814  ORF Transcript_13656/g.38814 Transcript_13656/m.38814 type:complete len:169 (-) Transcript_13656:234-740(-)